MNKIQNIYPVVSKTFVSPRLCRLSIDAGPVVDKAMPGQFIHVRVNNGLEPFFRRPFSIHRTKKHLEIFFEVLGRGTSMLSQKNRGDTLDVLGPLGNSFSIPDKRVKTVYMIAGGMGVAPFLFLSDALKKQRPQIQMILFYGARTGENVFSMKEFKQNGCRVRVSTDDGSAGTKGRVTDLLPAIDSDPKTTRIYTCGPRPMMAQVQKFTAQKGIAAQASCEEVMSCGLGACLGCSIPTAAGYKTVCYDGPIFDLQEIILDSARPSIEGKGF